MKILTVVGTRPEIIRLSLIIHKLDRYADQHILVHTGQNFSDRLSSIFFRDLGIRSPDYVFSDQQRSLGGQLAVLFTQLEQLIVRERPDRLLVLGDTNSALSALLAERMGVPAVHMEAGNRCYDSRVPEEINRRAIDAVSTINMPYTPQSQRNLLREGVPADRIVLTGNPIYEVLQAYETQIDGSEILDRLSCGNANTWWSRFTAPRMSIIEEFAGDCPRVESGRRELRPAHDHQPPSAHPFEDPPYDRCPPPLN